MIEFFKKLFKNGRAPVEVRQKFDLAYFLANRHYLAQVQPEDLDDKLSKMSQSELQEHLARASEIWINPVFKEELRHMLGSQALFVAAECRDWQQSLIGRGTINGIGVVEERFKRLYGMHMDILMNSKKVEEEDKELIPQV